MDIVQLGLFVSRIESVCDEMGVTLQRAAFSPNIKDRMDFSCAVFDASGQLVAQAAHIPVHLGSMAYAMAGIVARVEWADGDMVVLNDPYLGGTHLPDVTVIAPLFAGGRLLGFVVNRAHHANIGSDSPGSMPLSTSLQEEGMVLGPQHLLRAGQWCQTLLQRLSTLGGGETLADLQAQVSANRIGGERLREVIDSMGAEVFCQALPLLYDYAERLALSAWRQLPDGSYHFTDVLDDDGQGHEQLPIQVAIQIADGRIDVNFDGTASQVVGNVNCPLSVAAAAVFYVFRCLLPDYAPSCHGTFQPLVMRAPEGCLVNAKAPAAVVAGNVETSSRVVDAVLGALAQALPEQIPAAAQGTMNNVAIGYRGSQYGHWDYYETIAGGMGAHADGDGLSAVQTHMTNTLNTPIESLESHYPMRVRRYQIRRGSGGAGLHDGGDGLLREFEFLQPAEVTLLTERRRQRPWGLAGAEAGQAGRNQLNQQWLPAKCQVHVEAGDCLSIETPGGGGWGGSVADC